MPISFQPASPSLLRPLPPPLSFSLSLWSSAREHRGPWFARAEARGGERPGERRRSKQEDEVEVEVEESQSQARAKAFQISREKKRPSKGALRWSQEHCTTLVPTPSVTSAISSRRASGQKQSLASQSIRQRGESRRNKKAGERGRKRAKSRCATISFPSLRPLLLLLALQLQSLELRFIESGQIKGGRERHEKKPGTEARQGRRRQGCCFSRRALSPHCSTPFLSLSLRSLSLRSANARNSPAQVRERVGALGHGPAHGLVRADAREAASSGRRRASRGGSSSSSARSQRRDVGRRHCRVRRGRRRGRRGAVSLRHRGDRRLLEGRGHGLVYSLSRAL